MWEPSEDHLNILKLDILVILIHFGQTQIYSKRLDLFIIAFSKMYKYDKNYHIHFHQLFNF